MMIERALLQRIIASLGTYPVVSCKAGFVVYSGDEMYPLGRNVFALPIRKLEKTLVT